MFLFIFTLGSVLALYTCPPLGEGEASLSIRVLAKLKNRKEYRYQIVRITPHINFIHIVTKGKCCRYIHTY